MLCFGLLLMYCEQPKQPVIDSFCQSYQRVIRQASESAIKAPLAVKQRIAANEIVYRCSCEGWKSPLCGNQKK